MAFCRDEGESSQRREDPAAEEVKPTLWVTETVNNQQECANELFFKEN